MERRLIFCLKLIYYLGFGVLEGVIFAVGSVRVAGFFL